MNVFNPGGNGFGSAEILSSLAVGVGDVVTSSTLFVLEVAAVMGSDDMIVVAVDIDLEIERSYYLLFVVICCWFCWMACFMRRLCVRWLW